MQRSLVGLLCLVITGCQASPVLEFVEQALDLVAPFIFAKMIEGCFAAVALCRDDRLAIGLVDLGSDSIGIGAFAGEECLNPIGGDCPAPGDTGALVQLEASS
ncbi:hypothetical protein [Phyllobacterium brassicacearum]|uniref:hypothetical protein n=1 Tax=Phyllobacterium brassicacearum TaxID=314235 RepID=UPI0010DD3AFD|nr:hypothetical protein [Phyllobacterium brassicacearum]TDQ07897.1 hypothetical protein DEV91_1658 [Phyllobacterium brassicacearum]